jgi:hypothetical protein
MKTKILCVALLSLAATAVLANGLERPLPPPPPRCLDIFRTKCVVAAPEIDPAQAMGALALLGGAVAILRARRNKKK